MTGIPRLGAPNGADASRAPAVVIRAVLAVVVAVVVSLAPSVAFAAGYGSTVPTEPPGNDPACAIDADSAVVGDTVSGVVSDIEGGDTVDVFFGGTLVAEVVATDGSATAGGAAAFEFTVPAVDPGTYQVVAVGSTFNVACTLPGGGVGFEVLASGETVQNGGGGGFPVTGSNVLWPVLIAVVLLLVGVAVRRRAGVIRRDTWRSSHVSR